MKRILIILFLLLQSAGLLAQSGQSIFNSSVDRINCQTIKFIHVEAGRPQKADDMSCYTFESILNSIPEDEEATTRKVAHTIEGYKAQFSEGEDVGAELDQVISYAAGIIESKPRKGDVAAYKAELAQIKREAIAAAAPESDLEDTGENEPVEEAADAESDGEGMDLMSLLPWIALGLSVLSLLLTLFMMGRINSHANEADQRINDLTNEVIKLKGPAVTESPGNYNLLERNMHMELHKLRQEMEELRNEPASGKSSAPSATVTPPAPSASATAPDIEDPDKMHPEDFRPALIPEEMDNPQPETAYTASPEPEEEEEESYLTHEVQEVEYEQGPAPIAQWVEDDVQQESEPEFEPEPEPENGLESELGPEPQPEFGQRSQAQVIPPNQEETAHKEHVEEQYLEERQQHSPPQPAAEPTVVRHVLHEEDWHDKGNFDERATGGPEEEVIWQPEYRYAPLPANRNYFLKSEITDEPNQDSVYEIEFYDGMPGKAFFFLLNYNEVIDKALDDPDTYLSFCCDYKESPEGKDVIQLLEEGVLEEQDDHWVIRQRAKVKFS